MNKVDSFFRSLLEITSEELASIPKNGLPRCLDINDHSFVIGKFKVEQNQSKIWIVTNISEKRKIAEFETKRSAFFFCLFTLLKQYHLASGLLSAQRKIESLRFELEVFRKHIRSTKTKDAERSDTLQIRLESVSFSLKKTENQLKKLTEIGRTMVISRR